MLKLENLKSAEVIADLEKAFDLLSARTAAAEALPVGRKGVTTIERAETGAIKVTKASDFGISSGDGSPALPAAEEIKRLAELRGLKWDPKYLERAKMFWASDERVDAHGDIVRQVWHFDEFAKNSVMPYSHDSHKLGVGKWIDWRVLERRSSDYSGPALWALGLFATQEVDEVADRVFRHVDAGLLSAVSVGFYSTKVIDVKDEAERQALGLGRWGYILDENHLIEISPTLIGANPGALVTWQNAKARNLLRLEDFPHLRELQRAALRRGKGDVEAWSEQDKKLRAIATTLFPGIEWREHKNLDEPVVGKASTLDAPPAAPTAEEKGLVDRVAALEELVKSQSAEIKKLTGAFSDSLMTLSQTVNEIRDIVEDLAPAGSAAGQEGEDGADPERGKAAKGGQEVKPSEEPTGRKNAPNMSAFQRALAGRKS